MPVTARLFKAFYDRFGEEIVTELVEWLRSRFRGKRDFDNGVRKLTSYVQPGGLDVSVRAAGNE